MSEYIIVLQAPHNFLPQRSDSRIVNKLPVWQLMRRRNAQLDEITS